MEDYDGKRLPHLRLLLRHVHRQLHELPDRGHRHGPAGATAPFPPCTPPGCGWPSTTGMQIMELVEKNIRPRDIMTRSRLPQRRDRGHGAGLLHQHHAAPARHCPRGRRGARSATWSTASAPRPPTSAIWPLPVTPYMEDLDRAGGVWAVMKELTKAGLLDTSLPDRARARPWGKIWQRRRIWTPSLIRPLEKPYSKTGGIAALLKGNLAPDGCVVKQSAVAPEMLRAQGSRPGVQQRGGGHRRHLRREASAPVTWWSSATRVPRAAPVCGRC